MHFMHENNLCFFYIFSKFSIFVFKFSQRFFFQTNLQIWFDILGSKTFIKIYNFLKNYFRSEMDVMYDESNFWHGKQTAHHHFNSLNRNHKHNFIKANDINYQERPIHASYSSSESESSQSRVPKYNSMVIGHSTRSLIQQVGTPYL